MLVGILSGESPVSGTCPVATVVISGGGAGDQSVGSPDVKVLVGWEGPVSSDRRASKSAGCSESEPLLSLENQAPHENRRVGIFGSAETFSSGRRPASLAKELGVYSQ